MPWRNSARAWGTGAKFFHWGSAITIMLMFLLGIIMINLPLSPLKLELFIWHKAIGITLLGVALMRLVWRWSSSLPAPPRDLSKTAVRLARIGHYWLYALMIAMPFSGWVINSAANFPLNWFDIFEVPPIVAPNPDVENLAKQIHLILAIVLGVSIAGHILAALYHHKIRRDDVLQKML